MIDAPPLPPLRMCRFLSLTFEMGSCDNLFQLRQVDTRLEMKLSLKFKSFQFLPCNAVKLQLAIAVGVGVLGRFDLLRRSAGIMIESPYMVVAREGRAAWHEKIPGISYSNISCHFMKVESTSVDRRVISS